MLEEPQLPELLSFLGGIGPDVPISPEAVRGNAFLDAKDDQRDLSVIYKTNQTLALLNSAFEASAMTKEWAKGYCSDAPKTHNHPGTVRRLNASSYCEGCLLQSPVRRWRPLVLRGATSQWEAHEEWGAGDGRGAENGDIPWAQTIGRDTLVTVDNGLEDSWVGTRATVGELVRYMAMRSRLSDEVEVKVDERFPPWSSLYAYIHQHHRLADGRYATEVMWHAFRAPRVIDRNNWFRRMGSCFNMMSVILGLPWSAAVEPSG